MTMISISTSSYVLFILFLLSEKWSLETPRDETHLSRLYFRITCEICQHFFILRHNKVPQNKNHIMRSNFQQLSIQDK